MFKRRAATPTPKIESPLTPTARQAEPPPAEPRVVPVPTGPGVRRRTASHGEVAVRAYYLWLERGRPAGTHLEDWLAAERQHAATA
jgi:hypothetical protein